MTEEYTTFDSDEAEPVELEEPKKKPTAKRTHKQADKEPAKQVDWSKLFDLNLDANRLQEVLYARGIKTLDDFLAAGVPKIASIVQAVHMADAQNLTVQVRRAKEKE